MTFKHVNWEEYLRVVNTGTYSYMVLKFCLGIVVRKTCCILMKHIVKEMESNMIETTLTQANRHFIPA